MLILMTMFLVVVIYHARLVEVTSRLDFLWKLQAENDLDDMEETQRTNRHLLKHILPDHLVNHFLRKDRSPDELVSQWHDEVGVMFAGIPNFHEFYSETKAIDCMRLLNEIIFDFDKLLMEKRFKSVEKIKTIGATYMAASGLAADRKTEKDNFEHLCALVDYAFALRDALEEINRHSYNQFRLRVGISCGPLVGGVIGARKPVYDIWGNTVNEASRMETTGAMDRIQVTKYTKEMLSHRGYGVECRGFVPVKGKGRMETWWVVRARGEGAAPRPAPTPPHPRSLAHLVYAMLQARKRIYTHPLDANAAPKRASSIRPSRAETAPSSARPRDPLRRMRSRNQAAEPRIRPHTSSLVVRRPDVALPTVSSVSAPHTPTGAHAASPQPHAHTHPHTHQHSPDEPKDTHKMGFGARLKAASFSYRRDRSPKWVPPAECATAPISNGAAGSFRIRSVTTASFFKNRNREKQSKEQLEMQAVENGDATTRM